MTDNAPFTWTSDSGIEITLPPMNTVSAGIIRKHRDSDALDFMLSVIEALADEEMLARFDTLQAKDIDTLWTAWQEAGAKVGESSGSST